jgi:hypothetical protein
MAVTKTGKSDKLVKATDKGNIKKNPNDTASEKARKKHNLTGSGPRKTPRFKKD